MKAWVLHNIGEFTYDEVEKPEPASGEVLVRVKAAGICGSDIPRIYQTGAHVHPLVPGHEFSGQVMEDAASHWAGKRVGIFPLIPCKKCGPCIKKQYEMCRNYSYLGSRRDGGFAEYVSVPESNLIEIPENVSYEQAAMMEPMAVAVHSMRRGFSLIENKDVSDYTVAVWGLGTIGIMIAMFLKQAGVKNILGVGNKEFQKRQLLELGIDESNYCDGKSVDAINWIKEKTDGAGANLIFECVGRNEVISGAVESTVPGGSIVLVGNPYSDMSFDKNTYWKILRNQIKITGTWNSSFLGEEDDDWHFVVDCLAKGKIAPERFISHRYDMEQLEAGFHIMRDKTEDYVKIMGYNA